MRRALFATTILGLVLSLSCKDTGKGDTETPERGKKKETNLDAIEENYAGGGGGSTDDWGGGREEGGEDELMGDEPAAEKPKLPPRPEVKKVCKGKGAKQKCTFRDPKPEISAAYGVQAMMGDFRWGMAPDQVMKVLVGEVEREYQEKQKKARSATEQDAHRRWRDEQIQTLKANQVRFTKASKHRWSVSLIQFEYEDDNGEEMIWIKSTATLRKFFFFKDGELWKVMSAYSTDNWPGKSYSEVVDDKFRGWFGPSPKPKAKKDSEGRELVAYLEWSAMTGEKIRSFDMTSVHGVISVVVVDTKMERTLGERLPNIKKEEGFSGTVKDVLGNSDVCYDAEGNITADCGKGGKEAEED